MYDTKPRTDRITQIAPHPDGGLIAGTLEGRLLWIDDDLTCRAVLCFDDRDRPAAHTPIYALVVADRDIYARNKAGSLFHARIVENGFDSARVVQAEQLADRQVSEQQDIAPTMVRGIGVFDDHLLLTNGYLQNVEVNRADLSYERVIPLGDGLHPIEDVVRVGERIAISDRRGYVHLLGEDPRDWSSVRSKQLDRGNCHSLVANHDGTGVIVTGDDGLDERFAISNGIIELDFETWTPTFYDFTAHDVETVCRVGERMVACGGFDGDVLLLEETDDGLRFHDALGPFTFQVLSLEALPGGRLAALCQDGTLAIVTLETRATIYLDEAARQAVWDHCELDEGSTVFATDGGFVVVPGGPPGAITEPERVALGRIVRRVVPYGEFVAGTIYPSIAFAHDGEQIIWETDMEAACTELAVGAKGIGVGTANGLVILDDEGTVVHRRPSTPVWTICADGEGGFVLGGRLGDLVRLDSDGEVVWESKVDGYTKRLGLVDGKLHVTGHQGLTIVSLDDGSEQIYYRGLLENTLENYCLFEGSYAAISYGMQLGWYDLASGDQLALYEDLPDFPLAIWVPDPEVPELCVAGRGGYVQRLRLNREAYTFDLVERSAVPMFTTDTPPPAVRTGKVRERYAQAFV